MAQNPCRHQRPGRCGRWENRGAKSRNSTGCFGQSAVTCGQWGEWGFPPSAAGKAVRLEPLGKDGASGRNFIPTMLQFPAASLCTASARPAQGLANSLGSGRQCSYACFDSIRTATFHNDDHHGLITEACFSRAARVMTTPFNDNPGLRLQCISTADRGSQNHQFGRQWVP
jgi:hypothetical protein